MAKRAGTKVENKTVPENRQWLSMAMAFPSLIKRKVMFDAIIVPRTPSGKSLDRLWIYSYMHTIQCGSYDNFPGMTKQCFIFVSFCWWLYCF